MYVFMMAYHIKTKSLPSVSRLCELLEYKNGKLFNKKRRKGTPYLKEAGSILPSGYRELKIDGKRFLAHRVVWKIKKKRDPLSCLDHKNGNKSDNRISNLREINHVKNMQNQKKRKTNTSGNVGVYWDKASKKWMALIMVNYKSIHLGRYEKKQDAIAARKKAEKEYWGNP